MSKKTPSKQANTLLNYFQSSTSKPGPSITSNLKPKDESLSMKMDINEGSDEEPIKSQTSKRRRVIDSDSDSERAVPVNITPKSKISKKMKQETPFKETNGKSRETSTKTEKSEPKTESLNKVLWLHETLFFLKPDKIKDSSGRKMDDPNYDQHTLYVPETYLNSLTPAMRQWWVLKSQHYDCVLFFKVGKFYELYHMDAVIGVQHLNLSFMTGEFAHSGFPEVAFGRMANSLVDQGFKVARVEQTETPDMMAERIKNIKPTKFDKVVNREVCQVTTKGTSVYGPMFSDAKDALPSYMLAIAEKVENDFTVNYGVCFVDTSIGIFHMAEFLDDRYRSKLLALLSQHPPDLVLIERNGTRKVTESILRKNAGGARLETLRSVTQFYNSDKTIKLLQENNYFKDKEGNFVWPKVLSDFIEDGSCKSGYELAMSALGACLWYLKDSFLDIQVFTMGKFKIYEPFVQGKLNAKTDYMILDSGTIENLNLLGKAGTLQKTLDLCSTAFGKRLLVQWICRPLCNIKKLVSRQEAIKELVNNNEYLRGARQVLKNLPDLDRQVMKIHTFGNKQFAEQHPDSRAIFYQAEAFFKRKILDLISLLRAFEKSTEILTLFNGCDSYLLRKITHGPPVGVFVNLTNAIEYFKSAFDQVQAEKEGKIIPQAGIDPDFDQAEEKIQEIKDELDKYLKEQRDYFKCDVVYFGKDKKRYQIEVPANKCHKVPTEYVLEGAKSSGKAVKRYATPKTKQLLADMMNVESERAAIVEGLNRKIFEKFGEWHEEWDAVTRCLAILDVLCSLAEYARTYSHDICLPKLLDFSVTPSIRISEGRHPCIIDIDNYVPNDILLGTSDNSPILILTGPNMGGKSTLMRKVALIIVMAQLGSYVPASECEINLVDRIFTRLGAQDDIMGGQSTFFVEVSEASVILEHATKHSFVLLDELGRGTSTHDGNAIATAYMKKLLDIKCRVIYSTHYHALVEHYGDRSDIQLGYMACMVENEGVPLQERVTFLYKLKKGVCSNSYGFSVAKLAGLPDSIVGRARELASELGDLNRNRQLILKLFNAKNATDIRAVISAIKKINFD